MRAEPSDRLSVRLTSEHRCAARPADGSTAPGRPRYIAGPPKVNARPGREPLSAPLLIRSNREPSSVEPGDKAGLAEVRFAQSREAPRERLGLVIALREFLQVPEQGDGRVVLS